MILFKTLRLKSSNPLVRQRTVEKLGGSDNEHDTELIVASLEDENPQVRCAAVRALERAPTETCSRAFLLALRDDSSEVRAAAARVLARRGDTAMTGPLSFLLSDSNPEAREAAASALRELGWKPSSSEESARFEIALGNTRAAGGLGMATVDPLAGELKQDTSFQRQAAAETSKELDDAQRVMPWLEALKDPQPSVRISAIQALEFETHEIATAELLKLFHDSDSNVRLAASQVLARRPNPAPAHFLPLLKDTNFEIRLAAVQVLGRLAHPAIAETLIPMLSDVDSDVRQATAKALGEIRSARAIEALVATLADEERVVRAAAEHALEQIDRNWERTESAQRALPGLEVLLDARPSWVRSAMVHLLEKIRGSNAEN